MISHRPVVWLIWDGASHDRVLKLVERGLMPNLAHLLKRGGMVRTKPGFPNCQTPPSLATKLTGVLPDEHGITGASVPLNPPESTGRSISGFEIRPAHPLVWESDSLVGSAVLLVNVPWVTGGGTALRSVVYGYRGQKKSTPVFTLPLSGGRIELPSGSGVISIEGSRVILSLKRGNMIYSLASLQRTGKFVSTAAAGLPPYIFLAADSQFLIYTEMGGRFQLSGARLGEMEYRDWPFLGSALEKGYRQGLLGMPRLNTHGLAEARLGSSILLMSKCIGAILTGLLSKPKLDALTIAYTPCIDTVQHELAFKRIKRFDAGALNWIEKTYRATDRQLAVLRDHPANPIIVVSSDHGYSEIKHNVLLNVVLRQSGFLRVDNNGKIDFATSIAYYHPANDGSIWVNRARGGLNIIGNILQTLAQLKHPDSGQRVISRMYTRDGDSKLARSGVRGGDVWLIPAKGFNPSASLGAGDDWLVPAHKASNHLTPNGDRLLDAILASNERELLRQNLRRFSDIRSSFFAVTAALAADISPSRAEPQHKHASRHITHSPCEERAPKRRSRD